MSMSAVTINRWGQKTRKSTPFLERNNSQHIKKYPFKRLAGPLSYPTEETVLQYGVNPHSENILWQFYPLQSGLQGTIRKSDYVTVQGLPTALRKNTDLFPQPSRSSKSGPCLSPTWSRPRVPNIFAKIQPWPALCSLNKRVHSHLRAFAPPFAHSR